MKLFVKSFLKRTPGCQKLVRLLRGQTLETPRDRLLKKMPKNCVCAEVGVHEGQFSEAILCVTRPTKLHLIDPWKYMTEKRMDRRGLAAPPRAAKTRWTFAVHRGFSSYVASTFTDGYFDWVYVDGNHLYEYVKQDLELFYPKLKPGGVLAGDDYGIEGWWQDGVTRAVAEFVAQRPFLDLQVIGDQFVIVTPGSGMPVPP